MTFYPDDINPVFIVDLKGVGGVTSVVLAATLERGERIMANHGLALAEEANGVLYYTEGGVEIPPGDDGAYIPTIRPIEEER